MAQENSSDENNYIDADEFEKIKSWLTDKEELKANQETKAYNPYDTAMLDKIREELNKRQPVTKMPIPHDEDEQSAANKEKSSSQDSSDSEEKSSDSPSIVKTKPKRLNPESVIEKPDTSEIDVQQGSSSKGDKELFDEDHTEKKQTKKIVFAVVGFLIALAVAGVLGWIVYNGSAQAEQKRIDVMTKDVQAAVQKITNDPSSGIKDGKYNASGLQGIVNGLDFQKDNVQLAVDIAPDGQSYNITATSPDVVHHTVSYNGATQQIQTNNK